MKGGWALKSIRASFEEYRNECTKQRKTGSRFSSKLEQYVKMHDYTKVFGLKIHAQSMYCCGGSINGRKFRETIATDFKSILGGQPVINKLFFQFFLPKKLIEPTLSGDTLGIRRVEEAKILKEPPVVRFQHEFKKEGKVDGETSGAPCGTGTC